MEEREGEWRLVQVNSLEDAVKNGNRRTQLLAIQDFLVHELEVNRCNTCMASKLRTGDTAALVLRLMAVMTEIEALPREDGQVSELDALRAKRSSRTPDAKNPAPSPERGIAGP